MKKGRVKPVTIIEKGYKDSFDLMKVYVNSSYFALNNAGHNLQIEQPEIFEGIVRVWLGGF